MSEDTGNPQETQSTAPPPPPLIDPGATPPPIPEPVPAAVQPVAAPAAAQPAAVPAKPRLGSGTIWGIAVLAFVVAAFSGLTAGFLGARMATDSAASSSGQSAARVKVIPSDTDEPVAAAAAAALPAVVNIAVEDSVATSTSQGLPDNHPSVPSVATGSGVSYRNVDGGTLIITNNHVVDAATKVTVRDANGNSMSAKVVGHDAETDIAVVRVERKLPLIQVGDSADLTVGQTVVAIGSPFGLEHSVTSGVVSALGRSLTDFTATQQDTYPLVDVIQTDAAINPGNSGGALVDREGKLIGINTAIYTTTQSSSGIGFAVPVNTAVRVADQMIAGKAITHPFIGIIGQTIDAATKKELNLSVSEGAVVISLSSGSGAQKGGVKAHDVVVSVNKEPVRSMDDLILLIRRQKVGDEVTLGIVRGKSKIDVKVVVGDKPANVQTSVPDTSTNQ